MDNERRLLLKRLGLFATAAYVAPVIVNISDAHASSGSSGSSGGGGSSGSSSSGSRGVSNSSSSENDDNGSDDSCGTGDDDPACN